MNTKNGEKKKIKLSKAIILIIPIIVMLSVMFSLKCYEQGISIVQAQIGRYRFNDYVKDTFTEEGIKILPIIYQTTDDKVTKSQIESEFEKAGIKINSISSENITTGTRIETEGTTYIALIYGDINGDGEVNLLDARKIVQNYLDEEKYEISGYDRIAANVDKVDEKEIDMFDARRILTFVLERSTIIDSIPESDISKDKQPPVITLIGDEEITLEVGQEYEELGANVEDDTRVELKIDSSNVDTSKPGTYKVFYTATDENGNTATATRTVIVVEKQEEPTPPPPPVKPVPNISLVGDRTVYINVDDEYVDAGVTVTNGTLETTEYKNSKGVSVNAEDFYKTADKYTITYTAQNSNGTNTATRTVIVVDYVTSIELSGNISAKSKEGEEIDPSGIKVKLTRKSGKTEENVNIKALNTGTYTSNGEKYELTITQNGETNNKAIYDESEDSKNKDKEIKVKVKCINPVDPDKNKESDESSQTITVIGKIRKFIESETISNPTGEIYSNITIAKLKTPEYQENIKYSKEGTDNNISYEITQNNMQSGSMPELRVEEKDGIATIKFYGTTPGTYTIKISPHYDQMPSTYETKTIEVTIANSTVVNSVEVVNPPYEGIKVREAGEAKEFEIKFFHIYSDENGEELYRHEITVQSKQINSITNLDNKITVEKLGNSVPLQDTDPVTKIKVTAKPDSVPNGNILDSAKTSISFTIDGKVLEKGIEVTIEQESIYTMSIPEANRKITLYADKEVAEINYTYKEDGGDVYSIIPIEAYNQYGEKATQNVIDAKNLLTDISSLTSPNIVFIDSASSNSESYIKVAGFNEKSSSLEIAGNKEFEKVESGKIAYIGIAINYQEKYDNQDDKLEKATIDICQGSRENAIKLTIQNIVKKDISKLVVTQIKAKEYCYEYKTPVITIGTGEKEKNIDTLSYTIKKDDGENDGATITEIKNNGNIDIVFTAPEKGTYKITASLSEEVKTNEISIEVVENSNINEIRFVDSKKVEQTNTSPNDLDFGTVRLGKPLTKQIKYYHVYYNNENKEVARTEITPAPDGSRIHILDKSDIIHYELDDNHEGDHGYINQLRIEVDEKVTTSGNIVQTTLNITNPGTDGIDAGKAENYEAKLSVTVGERITITDVKLIPVSSSDLTGKEPLGAKPTLYKNEVQIQEKKPEAIYTHIDNGKIYNYTVFKIELIDDEGEVYPITNSENNIHDNIVGALENEVEGKYANGLTFIDNQNRKSINDNGNKIGVNKIKVISLALEGEKFLLNTGTTEYIGIAAIDPEGSPITSIEVHYTGYIDKKPEIATKELNPIEVQTEGATFASEAIIMDDEEERLLEQINSQIE